ncbi:MAG: oxygenase MpaB family protein [Lutimonas sp.]
MEYFVEKGSVVRKIWGRSDIILFIFAGASAEFALNKAVDWLYFTGKLPSDPLGRLFSTVGYAREIVFSTQQDAHKAIDKIKSIHQSVERKRLGKIPDWAYRDVLFMLIYYSQAAFELLERDMNPQEKEELFQVFYRVGDRMELTGLPHSYRDWLPVRQSHLEQDLEKSSYSLDLFKQYRKHLGAFRYKMLIEAQKLVVPARVSSLLGFNPVHWLRPSVPVYKISKNLGLDGMIKDLLLPSDYKIQIQALDIN